MSPNSSATGNTFDLIVVGGGALGLSTAWYAARQRGLRVLVLEKYSFQNQLGSSAGATRQWRLQYSQDYMSRLVLQAAPLWDELQVFSPGATLIERVGCVWFGDPNADTTEGQITLTMQIMTQLGIPYTPLSAGQLGSYGFQNLPSNYVGFMQPDGGCINVAATLDTLYKGAAAHPLVQLQDNESVTGVVSTAAGVTVTTAAGTYSAAKLVLAAGAYTNEVLGLLGVALPFDIWQMPSAYFPKSTPDAAYPTWFAFQAPLNGPRLFYGFPEAGYSYPGYVRVAPDFPQKILAAPGDRDPVPGPIQLQATADFVRASMPGLVPTPQFTSTCLMALLQSPNQEMVLDFLPMIVPHHRNIVIQATGWGFKFVPLIGRILTELACDGQTASDISHFPFLSPVGRTVK